MALTIPEALKRVQNPMTAGILRSIATTSELGSLISIESRSGIGLKLDREGLLPSTTFIDDAGASTEESTGADDIPIVQFRRIVGNMDIDGLADAATPENRNRQVGKKAKSTWRLMKDKLINGGHTTGHTFSTDISAAITAMAYGPWLDSSRRGPGSIKYTHTGTLWQFRAPGERDYGPAVAAASDADYTLKGFNESNYITVSLTVAGIAADAEVLVYFTSTSDEFDGLWEMADPSMVTPVVGVNGDAFDIGLLDDLIDVQKIRENRAFLMNGKQVNNYFAAMRALGGSDPEHVSLPGYNNVRVPTYRGIPCLTEDNITNYTVGSGTVSDIALVSLNPDEGLVLGAQSSGGEVGALSPDADPRVRSVFGFRIERLGPLEAKDADRTRVKWYGAPALKSYLALAVRQGIVE